MKDNPFNNTNNNNNNNSNNNNPNSDIIADLGEGLINEDEVVTEEQVENLCQEAHELNARIKEATTKFLEFTDYLMWLEELHIITGWLDDETPIIHPFFRGRLPPPPKLR